jgi:hypothetical protein
MSFAAANKSYDMAFQTPVTLGSLQVEPGAYKVSFEGAKLTLLNVKSKTTSETEATVHTAPKKFSETSSRTTKIDGKEVIVEIHFAGTPTSLEFTK